VTDVMPVFVIKAKDNLALAALDAYKRACIDMGLSRQADQVQQAADEIFMWRMRHPDECKQPDHDHVPAGQPGSGSEVAFDDHEASP
jgi:hypothetical protein